MDVNTFEVQNIDMSDQLPFFEDFIGMSYRNFTVQDNLLYFTGETSSVIGVIDLLKKELLWHKNIKVKNNINPLIKKIKVEGNKFYVLDHGGTLHVFAKQ